VVGSDRRNSILGIRIALLEPLFFANMQCSFRPLMNMLSWPEARGSKHTHTHIYIYIYTYRNFHSHNPAGCTMPLRSNQPATEFSTRNILLGVKAAGAKGWQSYLLHVPIFSKSGSFNFLEPCGPVMGFKGITLPLPLLLLPFDFV
jgi:hypothetical protein